MLASQKRGAIYIGVTGDLISGTEGHEVGRGSKFTAQYNVNRLVWFEEHDSMAEAIDREKSLKRYRREWKINLIEEHNPDWHNHDPVMGVSVPHP